MAAKPVFLVNTAQVEVLLGQMAALAENLNRWGYVIHGGGSTDRAVLIHSDTGEIVGSEHTRVWTGGDISEQGFNGRRYYPEISAEATKHFRKLRSKE